MNLRLCIHNLVYPFAKLQLASNCIFTLILIVIHLCKYFYECPDVEYEWWAINMRGAIFAFVRAPFLNTVWRVLKISATAAVFHVTHVLFSYLLHIVFPYTHAPSARLCWYAFQIETSMQITCRCFRIHQKYWGIADFPPCWARKELYFQMKRQTHNKCTPRKWLWPKRGSKLQQCPKDIKFLQVVG